MRCWVEINLDIIRANYANAQKLCSSRVIPVIKADAYGMGAARVARALGAPLCAVATVAEADEIISSAGCEALVMGMPDDIDFAISRGMILTIYSLLEAQAVSRAARGRTARAHIKVNTGLNRLGFDDLRDVERALKLPNISYEGLYSHLALRGRAEDEAQFERLMAAQNIVHAKMLHICDSIGMVRYPEWQLDAVRTGAWLYGVCPRGFDKPELTRLPAAFKTKIAQIHRVPAGMCVGYDEEHPLARASLIATLSAGYADGYPRLNSVGEAEVGGRRARVCGLVCMDQMMVDVTDIPGVREGDTVTLLGDSIGIDEYALWANMNRNEALARLKSRAERVYIEGGNVV